MKDVWIFDFFSIECKRKRKRKGEVKGVGVGLGFSTVQGFSKKQSSTWTSIHSS
jgi:hypothetical protein